MMDLNTFLSSIEIPHKWQTNVPAVIPDPLRTVYFQAKSRRANNTLFSLFSPEDCFNINDTLQSIHDDMISCFPFVRYSDTHLYFALMKKPHYIDNLYVWYSEGSGIKPIGFGFDAFLAMFEQTRNLPFDTIIQMGRNYNDVYFSSEISQMAFDNAERCRFNVNTSIFFFNLYCWMLPLNRSNELVKYSEDTVWRLTAREHLFKRGEIVGVDFLREIDDQLTSIIHDVELLLRAQHNEVLVVENEPCVWRANFEDYYRPSFHYIKRLVSDGYSLENALRQDIEEWERIHQST